MHARAGPVALSERGGAANERGEVASGSWPDDDRRQRYAARRDP